MKRCNWAVQDEPENKSTVPVTNRAEESESSHRVMQLRALMMSGTRQGSQNGRGQEGHPVPPWLDKTVCTTKPRC